MSRAGIADFQNADAVTEFHVMNNLSTAVAIYRNESNAPRIAVRLEGVGKNTAGAWRTNHGEE